MSHDFEDIISILDGREEIVYDIKNSEDEIKSYLIKQFTLLLENQKFLDALPGHLNYGAVIDDRLAVVLERMNNIKELGLMN